MSRGLLLPEDDASMSEGGDGDLLADEIGEDEEQDDSEDVFPETPNGHAALPVNTIPLTEETIVKEEYASDVEMNPPEADSKPESETAAQRDRKHHFTNVLDNMSEIELDRYEAYRRSCLPRSKMKKVLSTLSGWHVHDDKILIVVCSLAKMFVGQIIVESRSLARSMGEDGSLRPHHVRKALRNLESEGGFVRRHPSRKFFRHCL